jgi:hypothetical protein
MEGVTAGDLGIIAGFLMIALLGFRLVGLLVRRGRFPLVVRWLAVVIFTAGAAYLALHRRWIGAVLFAACTTIWTIINLRRLRPAASP